MIRNSKYIPGMMTNQSLNYSLKQLNRGIFQDLLSERHLPSVVHAGNVKFTLRQLLPEVPDKSEL